MHITLQRFLHGSNSSAGLLSIDGQHQCFVIEDEPRAVKVAGETRIPAGSYAIQFRKVGGFHDRYAGRFPDIHEGMLELQRVPGFRYILIHCGNTEQDTAGCLLPNMGVHLSDEGEVSGQGSRVAYELIYPRIADALLRGDAVTISVRDEAAP